MARHKPIRQFFSDICYLRLDFETFSTVPVTSDETTTCPDTFKVTVSVNLIPHMLSLKYFKTMMPSFFTLKNPSCRGKLYSKPDQK